MHIKEAKEARVVANGIRLCLPTILGISVMIDRCLTYFIAIKTALTKLSSINPQHISSCMKFCQKLIISLYGLKLGGAIGVFGMYLHDYSH